VEPVQQQLKAWYSLIILFLYGPSDSDVIAIAIIIFAVSIIAFAVATVVISVLLTYLPAAVGVPAIVGGTKLFRIKYRSQLSMCCLELTTSNQPFSALS
jgi:hypothetical protein